MESWLTKTRVYDISPDSPLVKLAADLPAGQFPAIDIAELNQILGSSTVMPRAELRPDGSVATGVWRTKGTTFNPEDAIVAAFNPDNGMAMIGVSEQRLGAALVVAHGLFVALCGGGQVRIAPFKDSKVTSFAVAVSKPAAHARAVEDLLRRLAPSVQ